MAIKYLKKSPKTSSTDDTKTANIVEGLLKDIENSTAIGISSGASAPEELVQNLINKVKKNRSVSIEEVVVAEEKVIFKLPKELN